MEREMTQPSPRKKTLDYDISKQIKKIFSCPSLIRQKVEKVLGAENQGESSSIPYFAISKSVSDSYLNKGNQFENPVVAIGNVLKEDLQRHECLLKEFLSHENNLEECRNVSSPKSISDSCLNRHSEFKKSWITIQPVGNEVSKCHDYHLEDVKRSLQEENQDIRQNKFINSNDVSQPSDNLLEETPNVKNLNEQNLLESVADIQTDRNELECSNYNLEEVVSPENHNHFHQQTSTAGHLIPLQISTMPALALPKNNNSIFFKNFLHAKCAYELTYKQYTESLINILNHSEVPDNVSITKEVGFVFPYKDVYVTASSNDIIVEKDVKTSEEYEQTEQQSLGPKVNINEKRLQDSADFKCIPLNQVKVNLPDDRGNEIHKETDLNLKDIQNKSSNYNEALQQESHNLSTKPVKAECSAKNNIESKDDLDILKQQSLGLNDTPLHHENTDVTEAALYKEVNEPATKTIGKHPSAKISTQSRQDAEILTQFVIQPDKSLLLSSAINSTKKYASLTILEPILCTKHLAQSNPNPIPDLSNKERSIQIKRDVIVQNMKSPPNFKYYFSENCPFALEVPEESPEESPEGISEELPRDRPQSVSFVEPLEESPTEFYNSQELSNSNKSIVASINKLQCGEIKNSNESTVVSSATSREPTLRMSSEADKVKESIMTSTLQSPSVKQSDSRSQLVSSLLWDEAINPSTDLDHQTHPSQSELIESQINSLTKPASDKTMKPRSKSTEYQFMTKILTQNKFENEILPKDMLKSGTHSDKAKGICQFITESAKSLKGESFTSENVRPTSKHPIPSDDILKPVSEFIKPIFDDTDQLIRETIQPAAEFIRAANSAKPLSEINTCKSVFIKESNIELSEKKSVLKFEYVIWETCKSTEVINRPASKTTMKSQISNPQLEVRSKNSKGFEPAIPVSHAIHPQLELPKSSTDIKESLPNLSLIASKTKIETKMDNTSEQILKTMKDVKNLDVSLELSNVKQNKPRIYGHIAVKPITKDISDEEIEQEPSNISSQLPQSSFIKKTKKKKKQRLEIRDSMTVCRRKKGFSWKKLNPLKYVKILFRKKHSDLHLGEYSLRKPRTKLTSLMYTDSSSSI